MKNTLQTNYYGALQVTQEILPLVRDGGRYVNVSSRVGQLNKYPAEIRDAFLRAAKTDVPAVTALMEKFQNAVAEGKEKEAGFVSCLRVPILLRFFGLLTVRDLPSLLLRMPLAKPVRRQ